MGFVCLNCIEVLQYMIYSRVKPPLLFNRKDSPLFNKNNGIYATGGARKPSTLAA